MRIGSIMLPYIFLTSYLSPFTLHFITITRHLNSLSPPNHPHPQQHLFYPLHKQATPPHRPLYSTPLPSQMANTHLLPSLSSHQPLPPTNNQHHIISHSPPTPLSDSQRNATPPPRHHNLPATTTTITIFPSRQANSNSSSVTSFFPSRTVPWISFSVSYQSILNPF